MHGVILPTTTQDVEPSDGAKTALLGFVIPMASRTLHLVSGMKKSQPFAMMSLTVTLITDAPQRFSERAPFRLVQSPR